MCYCLDIKFESFNNVSLIYLQVNWTPKVSKDLIKQGILPDIKVQYLCYEQLIMI